MKAVLIDDEEPALMHLERLLLADGRVEIEGKYTSAAEGLEHLAANPADVVFLDIGMPEMNGLDSAERIQQLNGGTRVVYITAYSEYALQAFELQALDYLLKPVDSSRMAMTLNRTEDYIRMKRKMEGASTGELHLRCFKRLELVGASRADKLGWRTRKAQELFAYLLHLEGNWATKDRILDMLWPDVDPDKGVSYIHHSISRIRSLLAQSGLPIAIEFTGESYRLQQADVQTDVQLFQQGLEETPYRLDTDWKRYEHLLALYRGDYLEDHDYTWAQTRRTELRMLYLDLVSAMAEHEIGCGRARMAVQRLTAAREREPYSDGLCRLLLRAYAGAKDKTGLRTCYHAFAELLERDLGVKPETQTDELYRQLSEQ